MIRIVYAKHSNRIPPKNNRSATIICLVLAVMASMQLFSTRMKQYQTYSVLNEISRVIKNNRTTFTTSLRIANNKNHGAEITIMDHSSYDTNINRNDANDTTGSVNSNDSETGLDSNKNAVAQQSFTDNKVASNITFQYPATNITSNSTVAVATTIAAANSSNINDNIVIQMRFARRDRLGTNIQRPLFLMGYAHCYRQRFCITDGRQGLAKYFSGGFETCPKDIHEKLGWGGENGWESDRSYFEKAPITSPGVYAFHRDDGPLNAWAMDNEDCAFDEEMRKQWGSMIVNAAQSTFINNKTFVQENFFVGTDDPNVVTVAIHLRRGDQTAWKRKAVPDQIYVVLLRQLRSILKKAGKQPEVHLFSEDYGLIDLKRNLTANWTMYDGLVDQIHLAQDMRTKKNAHAMDMDINLRDWRHFVQADILVVGGTFSAIPALGRPRNPDPLTGLPLTINNHISPKATRGSLNKTRYTWGWSRPNKGDFYVPDQLQLHNLPEVFAKHDIIPVKVFFQDLVADWNAKYNPNTTMSSRKEDSVEAIGDASTANTTDGDSSTAESTRSTNLTVISEMTNQRQAWLDFETEIGRNFSYVTARFHPQEGHFADMVNKFRHRVLDQGFPAERFHTYVDRNFPEFIQNDPRYREHLAFLDNPKHPSARGAGYWFWKPLLIQHHLKAMRWGEFIVYCDADDHTGEGPKLDLLKSLARKMIAHEHNNSTQEFSLAVKRFRDGDGYCCPEKHWSKGATYQHFCPNRNQTVDDSGQYYANFLMVKKTVATVELIDGWAEAAANYYLINDVDKRHTDWPTVKDHRHDQSLLSCSLKCRYSADTHREYVQRGYKNSDLFLLALSPWKNATTI